MYFPVYSLNFDLICLCPTPWTIWSIQTNTRLQGQTVCSGTESWLCAQGLRITQLQPCGQTGGIPSDPRDPGPGAAGGESDGAAAPCARPRTRAWSAPNGISRTPCRACSMPQGRGSGPHRRSGGHEGGCLGRPSGETGHRGQGTDPPASAAEAPVSWTQPPCLHFGDAFALPCSRGPGMP